MMNKNLEMGVIKSEPKKWSDNDINTLISLKEQGYNSSHIAEVLHRTETSVSIKTKRLSKKNDTYNKKDRLAKYYTNKKFVELVGGKSLLDLYAGNSAYVDMGLELTTNDIDKKFQTTHNEDAYRLLCRFASQNKCFDIIDLDPYGSAYPCFEIALRLAKKGFIVTLGEMGHKRWKRLDYVRRVYEIDSIEKFTSEAIIDFIIKLGLRNKITLKLISKLEYRNIARIYFSIEGMKITEQWDKKATK